MKPQIISLLIIPVSLAIATLITIDDIAFGETKILAQNSNELGTLRVKPHERVFSQQESFSDVKDINLTDEQKKQIQQIQKEILPQISELIPQPQLTEEQKNQLQSGQHVQITLQTPTSEQKVKVQELMQLYMHKIEAVLTPEQRQKLRENKKDLVLFEQHVNW
jgi:Spy/CpxP family protein refolding chaperone